MICSSFSSTPAQFCRNAVPFFRPSVCTSAIAIVRIATNSGVMGGMSSGVEAAAENSKLTALTPTVAQPHSQACSPGDRKSRFPIFCRSHNERYVFAGEKKSPSGHLGTRLTGKLRHSRNPIARAA